MTEIDATEAQADFDTVLECVERGETFVITRHGRPIARLKSQAADTAAALDAIMVARKHAGRMTVEELLSARDEGRR